MGREPFVETLSKVGRAASRDETRPILTGVLMTILGDTLKMVATDSYRLAVKETKLGSALEEEVQAILQVKALTEVSRCAAAFDRSYAAALSDTSARVSSSGWSKRKTRLPTLPDDVMTTTMTRRGCSRSTSM